MFFTRFTKLLTKCRGNSLSSTISPQKFTKSSYSTTRKFPELLYFPHLFRWLTAKLKFKYLQKSWDPEFTEGSFIYGSTRAICRITEIIHQGNPHLLNNLLTENAKIRVKNDMEVKLSKTQRKIIQIKPHDIKLLVPMKVQLVKNNKDEKFCFVLLKSLSMKWYEEGNGVKLVLIVLETEFKRDYTENAKPDWTISLFNIVQCVLIGGNNTVVN